MITGGTASDYGGGIGGFGASLTLSSTTLSGNHAISGAGAWVGGDNAAISIENSTFAGNNASGFGGGLFVEVNHGSAVISGTTFSGNQAHSDAGGVAVSISKGPATIANSTIFGNSSASNGGGGVSLSSSEVPIAIRDSTISGNHSTGSNAGGGGISASENHPVRLENTIVAGNSADAGGADLDGPIDAAFNLIGSPSGATLTETVAGSNLIGVDPQLGPLQNNGGPTETMAITASSPAVNRGGGGLASRPARAAPPRRLPGRAVLRCRGRQRRRHRRLRAPGVAPRRPIEPVSLRQGEAEQEEGDGNRGRRRPRRRRRAARRLEEGAEGEQDRETTQGR